MGVYHSFEKIKRQLCFFQNPFSNFLYKLSATETTFNILFNIHLFRRISRKIISALYIFYVFTIKKTIFCIYLAQRLLSKVLLHFRLICVQTEFILGVNENYKVLFLQAVTINFLKIRLNIFLGNIT